MTNLQYVFAGILQMYTDYAIFIGFIEHCKLDIKFDLHNGYGTYLFTKLPNQSLGHCHLIVCEATLEIKGLGSYDTTFKSQFCSYIPK